MSNKKKRGGVSSEWKRQNYDMSSPVSTSTIRQLRKGGTFEANVSAFKAGKIQGNAYEAMKRFYGKNRLSKAGIAGPTATDTSTTPKTGQYMGKRGLPTGKVGSGAKFTKTPVRGGIVGPGPSGQSSRAGNYRPFVRDDRQGTNPVVTTVGTIGTVVGLRKFRKSRVAARQAAVNPVPKQAAKPAARPTAPSAAAKAGVTRKMQATAKSVAGKKWSELTPDQKIARGFVDKRAEDLAKKRIAAAKKAASKKAPAAAKKATSKGYPKGGRVGSRTLGSPTGSATTSRTGRKYS